MTGYHSVFAICLMSMINAPIFSNVGTTHDRMLAHLLGLASSVARTS